LQAQIDINAPVGKVWELVSDLSRMPQWSPQCRMMKPHNAFVWPLNPTDLLTALNLFL